MRYRTALISIVAFGLFFGVGVEESRAVVQGEQGAYYGEALNTSEKNVAIKIYSKASRGSSVLKSLKDYDTVEILEVVPYGWLKVKLKDGTEGYAESKMIRMEKLPPHAYKIREEGYTIHYSEEKQLLTLYLDGEKVLESKGSSGLEEHFTPKGIFMVDRNHSGEEAYSNEFEQGYRDYISFYEAGYLMHSAPYSKEGYVIPEENRKLGTPASHGCIRLPIPVAKYLYDNVVDGTLVIIE